MAADLNEEVVKRHNDFGRTRLPGLLGMEVVEARPELVVARLEVTEALITSPGFVFGAAIIALADTICGYGVFGHIEPGSGFTTIELKANFVGTARSGETLVARATPAHVGRATHVWDAVVENATKGRTIALFRCTQLILPRSDTRNQMEKYLAEHNIPLDPPTEVERRG
jgi:uncharacterized protein (TIGR00369 family)